MLVVFRIGVSQAALGREGDAQVLPCPIRHVARFDAVESCSEKAKAEVASLRAELGRQATENDEARRRTMRGFKIAHADLRLQLEQAESRLERLYAKRKATPKRIPASDLEVLKKEKKLAVDSIKMTAYQVETALFRMLGDHYARTEDEGRTLLHYASNSTLCASCFPAPTCASDWPSRLPSPSFPESPVSGFLKFVQPRYATTTVWNRIYGTAPATHSAPTRAPNCQLSPPQAKKARSCTRRLDRTAAMASKRKGGVKSDSSRICVPLSTYSPLFPAEARVHHGIAYLAASRQHASDPRYAIPG